MVKQEVLKRTNPPTPLTLLSEDRNHVIILFPFFFSVPQASMRPSSSFRTDTFTRTLLFFTQQHNCNCQLALGDILSTVLNQSIHSKKLKTWQSVESTTCSVNMTCRRRPVSKQRRYVHCKSAFRCWSNWLREWMWGIKKKTAVNVSEINGKLRETCRFSWYSLPSSRNCPAFMEFRGSKPCLQCPPLIHIWASWKQFKSPHLILLKAVLILSQYEYARVFLVVLPFTFPTKIV